MTLYIGVDFHPHQQTLAWCDTQTGETRTIELVNDPQMVREFYTSLPEPAVVGIEASARATWFEEMLFETSHKLLVGNPVLIRKRATSRHKNDRRDAGLILKLLLQDEFPAIWRRPPESDQILEILRLRRSFVRQRTQAYNRLQALAHSVGLPKGKIGTKGFQQMLKAASMNEVATIRRAHLFLAVENFSKQIAELDDWLKKKVVKDEKVQLLLTQKGVGDLTALATVHTLGDVSRFPRLSRQIANFAGLDPVEDSSAGRVRFRSISKAGSTLLRHQLGQAANIACRTDANLKSFYKRLAKKKLKPVAKTAAARKLLVKLSIMLRDHITADEFDRRGRTVGNARESHDLK
ncbi:MAG TPA: IS110 family transposase [Pyrinomonadaceae bacterium]|nr:IS110 family transposase [Pyrinomonadaceae bacterium]